jgi:hypothetical protein
MQAYTAGRDFVIRADTANGTPGELICVRTDLERPLVAWRPKPVPADANRRFFCHGYALDTYHRFGYSIVSGADLAIALADEFAKVGDLTAPLVQANDIIVMWGPHRNGLRPLHSAKIVNRVLTLATGALDEGLTLLNSKTGTGPLKLGVSLLTVRQDYPDTAVIEVYRRA